MEINEAIIEKYLQKLKEDEKSEGTIEKYLTNIREFCTWKQDREITKQLFVDYKKYLVNKKLSSVTVNSKLSALNGLLKFLNLDSYCVKFLKTQRKVFRSENKELTKAEYEKLVKTAYQNNQEQLALIIQTIGSTGIRVSELQYITKEAVLNEKANIHLKGKERVILIPNNLKKILLPYIKKNNITEQVFVTKNHNPIDRKQVWRQMKNLCNKAGVNEDKVFPHNLRHLFAVVFYKQTKDIVKLSDILGHSSINTTRIYLVSTGKEHSNLLNRLQLVC